MLSKYKQHALVTILTLFFLEVTAQAQIAPFVALSPGDTIQVAGFVRKKTNENEVTFLRNGEEVTLSAADIQGYFDQGYRQSLFIHDENQHKLVRIVLRGKVQLAEAISADRKFRYYLQTNDQWHTLVGKTAGLRAQLTTLLPDIREATNLRSVFYDLPSLGNALITYNSATDQHYTYVGRYKYRDQLLSFGAYAAIGFSTIQTTDLPGLAAQATLSPSFGCLMNFQYSRTSELGLQLGYRGGRWEANEGALALNAISFSPLLKLKLFDNLYAYELYAAAGFDFSYNFSSTLDYPALDSQPLELNGLRLGYEFQVQTVLWHRFGILLAYTITNKYRSETYGPLENQVELSTNQLRAGAFLLF